MKSKSLKYIALIVFGILLIKNYFPFGDYCKGFIQGLQLILFGGIFVLLFSILTVVNLFQVFKKRAKFDIVPMLIFILFSMSLIFLMELDHKKFWVKSTWKGSIQFEDRPQSGMLFLYKNNTFEATHNYADFSCTYVGDYEIKQDTLLLIRETIITDTDSLFANVYVFNTNKTKLIPILQTEFKIIEEDLSK
ncbi:hypothetical protein FIA58_017855 [Flavobacterium jejuense]|uniref:GRAM domain-containing protein n=1 Tax=Flavobacterium jejuense TaxID=1544455 RepID=A0ABX0IV13_9FLAO|nr:hypothetical protein [Flavobacterium jejuense]NHN27548.1 hypothetical protein [Flavobacterium jejuense]